MIAPGTNAIPLCFLDATCAFHTCTHTHIIIIISPCLWVAMLSHHSTITPSLVPRQGIHTHRHPGDGPQLAGSTSPLKHMHISPSLPLSLYDTDGVSLFMPSFPLDHPQVRVLRSHLCAIHSCRKQRPNRGARDHTIHMFVAQSSQTDTHTHTHTHILCSVNSGMSSHRQHPSLTLRCQGYLHEGYSV